MNIYSETPSTLRMTSLAKDKPTKVDAREQSRRFIETARKLGVDETEAGHEKALGKVG